MIRYVENNDKAVWYTLDQHLPESSFEEKVRNRHGYVCVKAGRIIGTLRFNLFWDSIPFCTMLHIDNEYQGQEYGKKMMDRWEQDMKSTGCGMAMTSTHVNEETQHFYRKLGYKDAGGFVVDVPGYEQPMEMIMIKAI